MRSWPTWLESVHANTVLKPAVFKSLSALGLLAALVLLPVWRLEAQANLPVQTPSTSEQNANAAAAQPYVDRAGGLPVSAVATNQTQPQALPPQPVSDLQRLAYSAIGGDVLPVFGQDLFSSVPSTFAPGDQIAVPPDYVLGPGDDILIRVWGPTNFNGQLTVDRSGSIYIPEAGSVHVAGLRFDQLEDQVKQALGRIYRNFNLTVSLGRLRSIQVYVVGEARRPGAYTISSLSTLLNALFVSGGPNVRGSMRKIELRRGNTVVTQFDLYDLILRGDKSKDVRLESGDTIFIPAMGAQVAIGGSVRRPAIYELRNETTMGDLLTLAGGFTATASPSQASLDRIVNGTDRQTVNIALDAAGRGLALRDGDVLYIGHITAAYQQTVTIRGNLANPGRFHWHEGMRLSEIIPDRMSLLTTNYWSARNALGVPVPLFESAAPVTAASNVLANSTAAAQAAQSPANQRSATRNALQSQASIGNATASDSIAVSQGLSSSASLSKVVNGISIPAPEIDWSYAVIERLDPVTLKNTLVPFNLGKLVMDHDASQDLLLQPGDVVTIFSQADITVPRDAQTKFVRVEGEVESPGVYSVGPNDTLQDLVLRAGGLTSKAYLYGSSFRRESARALQQLRLDEYINDLSVDFERSAATMAANGSGSGGAPTGAESPVVSIDRDIVSQLRSKRATGRIVLEFTPQSEGDSSIPRLPLEDADVFSIPARPDTINVVGAVNGQNVFLYDPSRRLIDYVARAGKPDRTADWRHAFVIRANGSVIAKTTADKFYGHGFDSLRMYPGDTIVVPDKLIKPSLIRQISDYASVLSSFGIAAVGVNALK